MLKTHMAASHFLSFIFICSFILPLAFSKEHCKGMEGLVAEATKHVLEEGPAKGSVLDVLIIAQYQRMTHYGIAGFGTAAAYAKALGLKDDNKKLRDATKEIYGGDEYMTQLAETSVNLQAEGA